jgi:6-pyruvoyl tetrahydropterin synthase
MSSISLADNEHVATMHRADSPVGQRARLHMRKLFDNLPCCRSSWANQGRRLFLHGYERTFEVEFACAKTEPDTGVVVDPSAVKEIRAALRYQFDHTTLIAADDPQRDLFELMAEQDRDGGLGGLGVRPRRADRRAGDRGSGLGVAGKGT